MGNSWEKSVFGETGPADDISGAITSTSLSVANEVSDCGVVAQGNIAGFKGRNLKILFSYI